MNAVVTPYRPPGLRNRPVWNVLWTACVVGLAPGCAREGSPAGERPGSREEVEAFLLQVDRTLDEIRGDPQALRDGCWVRAHWLLAFGSKGSSRQARQREFRNLMASLLEAGPSAGHEPPFVLRRGLPFPRAEGSNGDRQYHRDQFLGYMAIAGVPLEVPMTVEGRKFHLAELLEQSLQEVRADGELSWTLMAYSHYLEGGRRWRNKFGEELSVTDLIVAALAREEKACAGAHYLCALAHVASSRPWRNDPDLRDLCQQAGDRLRPEIQRLRDIQGEDGRFELKSNLPDYAKAVGQDGLTVYYTGHAFEWLALAVTEVELREPWVMRCVAAVRAALDAERASLSGLRISDEVAWRRANVGHATSGLSRWADRNRTGN